MANRYGDAKTTAVSADPMAKLLADGASSAEAWRSKVDAFPIRMRGTACGLTACSSTASIIRQRNPGRGSPTLPATLIFVLELCWPRRYAWPASLKNRARYWSNPLFPILAATTPRFFCTVEVAARSGWIGISFGVGRPDRIVFAQPRLWLLAAVAFKHFGHTCGCALWFRGMCCTDLPNQALPSRRLQAHVERVTARRWREKACRLVLQEHLVTATEKCGDSVSD